MFANAIPFVGEYGPWSWLRLASPSATKRLLANPREAGTLVARSAIGTFLLADGLSEAFNSDSFQSWFEQPVEDIPLLRDIVEPTGEEQDIAGSNKFVDHRPMAPLLAAYRLMGWGMMRPEALTTQDWTELWLGMGRVKGTPLELTRLVSGLSLEDAKEMMYRQIGAYVGSFATPARAMKDVLAGFHPDDAIVRDYRDHPVIGPFISKLPRILEKDILGVDLPPSRNALYPGLRKAEHPWLRQAFGVNIRTKNFLEREATSLNMNDGRLFRAHSPDSKVNRMVNYYYGTLNNEIMKPIIESPEYQARGEVEKELIFGTLIREMRGVAWGLFLNEHPYEGQKAFLEKKIPDIIFRLFEERGVDLRKRFEERNGGQ